MEGEGMEGDREQFEVVYVIKPFRLVDAESYERSYWRRDGVPLAPGYYVVSWLSAANPGRFNEDALFRGPFRGRKAAQESLQQMVTRLQQLRAGSETGRAAAVS